MKFKNALKNSLFLFGLLFTLYFISGCGHTMYHKVEGTGIYGRIPTPNGSSLIEVAIGDMNITSGILRGGATLDENTSKGGTFGTVSIGRHTHLSTTPAMNEGNIRDVLISQHTDDKTKQLIAEYLITRGQNVAPASAVTAVNAGAATGDKSSIPEVKPTKTGLDNVVEKVADVAPKVVTPIAENTAKTVIEISDDIESGSTKFIDGFWWTITIWGSIIILIAVLIILIIIFVKKQKLKKNNETKVSTEETVNNNIPIEETVETTIDNENV
jgi:hypothetical protein